jgi:fluoroquinolone transport system ATP-binding protein
MKISAQEVSFTYRKTRRKALNGLNFDVKDGEIFGFLGPSGAGKSTTLGILTGTITGWDGTVEVGGMNPAEARGDFYRNIGVCFESPRFHMKFSAAENLRLFGALYGKTLRNMNELMARVGLADHLNKKVEAYSKGMKTRLSLVRSLLHNPDLLFLDEPTNGLDPTLTRTVCDLIREERDNGKTVFLTTHDMETAASLCDRVGFITDGDLVLTDSPQALALRFGRPELRLEYRDTASGLAERQIEDFPLEGLADNEAFLSRLRAGNVETIHSREASLDDIFRQVTGRNLT